MNSVNISVVETAVTAAIQTTEVTSSVDIQATQNISGSERTKLSNITVTSPVNLDKLTYIHDQPTASTVWNVTHSLGRMPSVTIADTAGTIVISKIEYIDDNNVKITHNNAFSGKAYFN